MSFLFRFVFFPPQTVAKASSGPSVDVSFWHRASVVYSDLRPHKARDRTPQGELTCTEKGCTIATKPGQYYHCSAVFDGGLEVFGSYRPLHHF